MLGIPRDEKVYTHLIEYTKEFEKKNPQFPKNTASYLDSTAWPPVPEEQSIFLYNQENPENAYLPLSQLPGPSLVYPDGYSGHSVLDDWFILLAKQWISEEARYTSRRDSRVPLSGWRPQELLSTFDLFVLEYLLIELAKIKENQNTPFDYILDDKEEFDGDGRSFLLGYRVAMAIAFECYKQNKNFTIFSNEFGALFNYAYIRLLQELGDHLGSIFKSWVYPFGPYLPKGFQQNL